MTVFPAIAAIVGIPSITSIVLLLDLLLARAVKRPLLWPGERRVLLWTVAGVALVLYPTALGFAFDVYRFGFSAAAPLVIAAAGVVAALRRETRLALLALVALVALDLQLLPSLNAFDYVLDPIVGLVAVLWAGVQLMTIITHA